MNPSGPGILELCIDFIACVKSWSERGSARLALWLASTVGIWNLFKNSPINAGSPLDSEVWRFV